MNTNIEVLRELDELVEAARLLGVTQAKKGVGCHTDEDRRFERAMYESIDKHRAALLDWGAKQPTPQQPEARGGVEAEPPSAPVADFAAVAAILRRALRDGAHYGYRRGFILQQALALEALSHQPAARPPKPTECMNGCPARQVCDHCQWPPGPDQQPAAVDGPDAQAAEARAERLAEALRELVDVFSESGMYDEEVFDKARAALAKENSND